MILKTYLLLIDEENNDDDEYEDEGEDYAMVTKPRRVRSRGK